MYSVSFSYGGSFNSIEMYVAAWAPWLGGPEKASGVYVILCRTHIYLNFSVTV